MRRDGGFVLVNALILVAALSAVAVYLLTRAEGSRTRLEAGAMADALDLGLDAAEALALTRLADDLRRSDTDHLDEPWARPERGLALAQGAVDLRLVDAGGLFNLNWLADPGALWARPALDRLITSLGLPPSVAEALAAEAATARVLRPEIAGPPGLDAASAARLWQHLAVLPGAPRLNVNTAPRAVLLALLPQVPPPRVDQVLVQRQSAPFPDAVAALTALSPEAFPEDDPSAFPAEALDVGSAWFRLEAAATVADRRRARQAVIERRGPGAPPRVAWRLTLPP